MSDRGARAGLPPAAAHLAAWLAMAAVNVSYGSVLTIRAEGGGRAWLDQTLYEVGYLAAAGLVAAAMIELWRRHVQRGRRLGLVALAGAALSVGVLTLPVDLEGAAYRVAGGRTLGLVHGALVVVGSLVVPVAAWAASQARAQWTRGAWMLGACGLGAANHLVLPRGYLSVHLFAAWTAAVVLGVTLSGDASAPGRVGARRGWDAVRALCAAVGAWALVVPPSPSTLAALLARSGSPLAAYVARVRTALVPRASVTVQPGAWYVDRRAFPDVPPSQPPLVEAPVVILLIVDAARWDVIVGEQHRAQLPTLHRLRDEGVHFRRAVASGNETASSVAGLMTGKHSGGLCWTKRRRGRGLWPLFLENDDSVGFAEVLSRAGIPTVLLAPTKGLLRSYGLCPGFAEESRPGWEAGKLRAAAAERLQRVGPEGLLLYAHFMEPHAPYDAGGEAGTPFERYLSEIAVVDRELAQLMATVERVGLGDRTVWIVAADHGEAFGEHESTAHGSTLYREQIQVVLLVRGPGVRHQQVDEWVSLLDIGPTVLDLMGRPTPASFLGQSLVPYLRGARPVRLERPVAMQTSHGQLGMYFPDGTKVLYDRRSGLAELFDVASDPGELYNLFDPNDPDHGRRMLALRAFFRAHDRTDCPSVSR